MADIFEIAADITRRAMAVQADEDRLWAWSTGEKLAVALVLDRADLLAKINGGYSMLEAIERLGPDWSRAALAAQRAIR